MEYLLGTFLTLGGVIYEIKTEKIKKDGEFFSNAKKYFIIAVLASFLSTGLNALTPQVFRFTIDSVLGSQEYSYLSNHLWLIAGLLVFLALLSGISLFVCRANASKAGENFAKNMRDSLFSHVQKLPMEWHDKNQTGDIIQRCTSDVEVIRNFVVTQLLEVFRTAFLVISSFGMMWAMNRKLSLVVLLFVPIVIIYSTIFYRLIAKRFTVADEAEGELSTVVQENATGVRVVRAFGREQFEMERFQDKNEKFAKLWIRLGSLSGLYWGVGDFITGLQVITIIVLGTVEAVKGSISVGEFIAFASYNTALVWPIRGLGRILSDMSKAGVSFERVNYIIHGKEEGYGQEYLDKKELPHYDIVFSNVSFQYSSGKQVLSNIDFTIPQGTTFGILGGTGSGKSTIAQLLNRLYQLPENNGSITLGGIPIDDIPLEALRKKIGIVLQEPFLYSRTIKENIEAASPGTSIEDIRQAAKIACVDESISHFKDGYETMVGERGITLSGGQKQRVAIARMLLQKAPILIFDDSLSAVDSQTDSLIRKALKQYEKEATILFISHRVATLMGADQIIVLNQGHIAERGTHEELMAASGIYRQVYDIQMSQDDRKKVET